MNVVRATTPTDADADPRVAALSNALGRPKLLARIQTGINQSLSFAARKSKNEQAQRISIRLIGLIGKLIPGNHTTTVKLPTGSVFSYPLSDGYWSQIHGGYEPELGDLLCHICRNSPTVFVDGGANRGYYSALLAPIASEVIPVEPTEELARWTLRNLHDNDCESPLIRKALWNQTGQTIDFSSHDRLHAGGGVSSVAPAVLTKKSSKWRTFQVETTTVDHVLSNARLAETIDFLTVIKLDVEGAEQQALEGSEHTLATRPSIVIYEQHPAAPSRASFDYLARLDFRQLLLLKDRSIELRSFDQLERHFADHPSKGFNLAATKRSSIGQRTLDDGLARCARRASS